LVGHVAPGAGTTTNESENPMVMGKTTKQTTKPKTDVKATANANKQDAEKRALLDKFKDKTSGGTPEKP
jgi:hypothetical protein